MLVGKLVLDEEVVERVIQEIIKKKELKSLSKEFVREVLYAFLSQDTKATAFLSVLFGEAGQGAAPERKSSKKPGRKSAQYKAIIKHVRAKLRKFYGQYRRSVDAQRIQELVERLLAGRIVDQHLLRDLLALNASTKERLAIYDELYEKLFQVMGIRSQFTGRPTSIIDLGCGLNPFSIPWMRLEKLHYYAYDVNEEEITQLQEFFRYLHLLNRRFRGKAEVLDALHLEGLLDLKKVDLCFLFKMTDVLDRGKGHRATEAVITSVPARFVVVSFPTRTLSGKRMNVPEKRWVELMCQRLGYTVTVLKFPTEIFYVVRK
ncbi:MAG: hypothetical protein AABX13_06640 [Nanoarchaeota archaeon]